MKMVPLHWLPSNSYINGEFIRGGKNDGDKGYCQNLQICREK